jgi:hypothetical protein
VVSGFDDVAERRSGVVSTWTIVGFWNLPANWQTCNFMCCCMSVLLMWWHVRVEPQLETRFYYTNSGGLEDRPVHGSTLSVPDKPSMCGALECVHFIQSCKSEP